MVFVECIVAPKLPNPSFLTPCIATRRREILHIHFDALRQKGRLSQPLCCAIDGVLNSNANYEETSPIGATSSADSDIDGIENEKPKGRKRRAVKRAINKMVDAFPVGSRSIYDLAADSATGGFSGADIAGLVRCAGSLALARARKDGNGIEGLLITMEDVKEALDEVKQ